MTDECRICDLAFVIRDGCDSTGICDECAQAELEEFRSLLETALGALRSYQYGNASPELAESVANQIFEQLELPK